MTSTDEELFTVLRPPLHGIIYFIEDISLRFASDTLGKLRSINYILCNF